MKILFVFAFLIAMLGCEMPSISHFDNQFGDQHFKSAVAQIELHRVRTGSYPPKLSDLEHLGDWDQIWVAAVEYERFEDGYNLYIKRGWAGEPDLKLPAEYKNGLGLKQSNIDWVE